METIERLEGLEWPALGPHATSLTQRCAALRRKPLARFTVEDIRVMIGQRVGVSLLLPLAVNVLIEDPLAEGDYYPGDLLATVIGLPDQMWSALMDQRQRLAQALARVLPDAMQPELRAAVARFIIDPGVSA